MYFLYLAVDHTQIKIIYTLLEIKKYVCRTQDEKSRRALCDWQLTCRNPASYDSMVTLVSWSFDFLWLVFSNTMSTVWETMSALVLRFSQEG